MWLQIAIAWAAATLFVVAPGYLLARGAGCGRTLAIGVAPFVSVAVLAGLAIVYGMLGIPAGWAALFLPPLVAGAALAVWRSRSDRDHGLRLSPSLDDPVFEGRAPWLTYARLAIALAVGAGVLTSFFVYVCSIDDPNSFIQSYDNAFHLTRIRTFLDTRNYSSIRSSFYPSAWHCIAAMAADATGIGVAASEIVANLAFVSVAYPLGMFLMLAAIFPERPRRVLIGSLACLTMAFFPWRLMLFGPLFPNVSALCLVPGVVGVFILLCADEPSMRQRAVLACLFVIGGISLALTQPNGVFSAAVILIPFCLRRVRTLVFALLKKRSRATRIATGLLAEAAAFVVIAGIWYAAYRAPFMQDIVQYPHEPILSFKQAVNWGLCFSFTIKRQQYFLGAVVILGLALSLLRDKTRWVGCSFAFALVIYAACASLPADSAVKALLSGFWYNDTHRVAATECIAAVPVIAIGFDAFFELTGLVAKLVAKLAKEQDGKYGRTVASGVAIAVLAALLTLNAFPWDFIEQYWKSYGFDAVEFELRAAYNDEANHFLGTEEIAFLNKVADETQGALIINQPYDGSVFAYSICDLNVETKVFGIYEREADDVIANSLDELAENPDVQAAVREVGAEYVLQLDKGDSEKFGMNPNGSIYEYTNGKEFWGGINRVDEDTPGFELALSEGDMRLYKIVL